jgi:dihydrofolate reductase
MSTITPPVTLPSTTPWVDRGFGAHAIVTAMPKVHVFIACSLDGFIAGPNDEMDWLEGSKETEDTFTPFMAEVGSMLMGRRTYDVVCSFGDVWPYGDTPVLVATSKSLDPKQSSVSPVAGTIAEMVEAAKAAAGDKAVYIDGGSLIRSALDAKLVDEMTVTMIPMVLGAGVPLFAGVTQRHPLELLSERSIGGGLVELKYRLR